MRATFLAIVLAPAIAAANGRFPATMSVAIRADDPGEILVGATFGAVLTRDGGETWRWICEDAVGYSGLWDPTFVVDPVTGALAATTPEGIRVSEDGGCTWETRGEGYSSDLEIRDDGTWIRAGSPAGGTNGLLLSTDRGATWEPSDLQSDGESFKTLVLSADRAYVVGYAIDPTLSTVYRSDDGGDSWRPSALPTEDAADVYLLGVDPSAPDLVYDYTSNAATGDPPNWVLRRGDADLGTREVVLDDRVEAFAVSADGRTVLAGNDDGTVHRSTDGGSTFTDAAPLHVRCFSRVGGRLWACSQNWDDGFALGASDDWGDSWDGLLRFSDISGVVECADGTPVADLCGPLYSNLCDQLGIGGPGCTRPPDDGGPGQAARSPSEGCGCSAAGLPFATIALAVPWVRRRG